MLPRGLPFEHFQGFRSGRVVIVREAPKDSGSRAMVVCLCDCGKEFVTQRCHVACGRTISCGCSRWAHGHSAGGRTSRTYNSWSSMWARVTSPRYRRYYMDRGITICERWEQFTAFLADMGERPPNTSLDRTNNDGNYEPGNCRWATPTEQSRNRRKPLACGRGHIGKWRADKRSRYCTECRRISSQRWHAAHRKSRPVEDRPDRDFNGPASDFRSGY